MPTTTKPTKTADLAANDIDQDLTREPIAAQVLKDEADSQAPGDHAHLAYLLPT